MMTTARHIKPKGQKNVFDLRCDPVKKVRIAFIGLGKRGMEALNHYMFLDGIEVRAICDLRGDRLENASGFLEKNGHLLCEKYIDEQAWKKICERDDIDLVYICTHRKLHAPIAAYAMNCGKHAAVEVPAACTIQECFMLIDAAEKNQKHCFILENCCYDYFELAVLNMVENGRFGNVFHCEGAYIHDLRNLDFNDRSEYLDFWYSSGNPYPTHGFAPLCRILDLNRSDKPDFLVSCSSAQFNYPESTLLKKQSVVLGNINTTIIKTKKGKTIQLQFDVSSPRPRTRNFTVSGTSGFARMGERPLIALGQDADKYLSPKMTNVLLKEFEHPFYKEKGRLARKVGAHGGMDFIMDWRLIQCLQNGMSLDFNVYDAVLWSSLTELTALSVENGSAAVKFPDFI